MHKCAACGFESDDFPGSICPQCGKKFATGMNLVPGMNRGLFLITLLPVVAVVGFMSAFHVPPAMIVFCGVGTLLPAILALRSRGALTVVKSFPRRPPSPQPTSVKLLDVAIGLCGFCFLACLLFCFVAFLNSYMVYRRFQGQPYHATAFQVLRPYYQISAGMHGPDIQVYARGLVEGNKEWMDLLPYLKRTPNGQGELNDLVPQGTVIPVYLFPNLKGRMRVQVIGALPPAETNYNAEMLALRKGSIALAALGALLFVLVLIRRSCAAPATQAMAAGA